MDCELTTFELSVMLRLFFTINNDKVVADSLIRKLINLFDVLFSSFDIYLKKSF